MDMDTEGKERKAQAVKKELLEYIENKYPEPGGIGILYAPEDEVSVEVAKADIDNYMSRKKENDEIFDRLVNEVIDENLEALKELAK